MRINEQGRLVVNFRTKARFRGLFVESHSGGRIKRAGEIIIHVFYYSLASPSMKIQIHGWSNWFNSILSTSPLLNIYYQATSMSSMVMSVDHPGLTFNLTLVRSEPTYNQPVQQWTFTSDFAVRMTSISLFVHSMKHLLCKLVWSSSWKHRYRLTLEYVSSLIRTGERLLWDLHSEADPLYNSPEYGIHSSTCLQSQRTNHLRSRHQIPASK